MTRLSGIDRAHYHGWSGTPRSPWYGSLAIARVAVLQVLRRKMYWFAIGLGLMVFLLFFFMIYLAAQIDSGAVGLRPLDDDGRPTARAGNQRGPQGRLGAELLRRVSFSPQPGERGDNGYLRFMERQSLIVIILLAFSGSLVVGADYRHRALPFYLSRGIDRRHYIVGKWLGISAAICMMTVLPALALFVEYGVYTTGFDYWIEFWWIVPAVLGYGLVLCIVLGLITMTLSAYLQRTAPIAISTISLFSMLWTIGMQMADMTESRHWRLLDLWRDMRYSARWLFDPYRRGEDVQLGPIATAILAGVCVVCLVALFHRVRAVDIIE